MRKQILYKILQYVQTTYNVGAKEAIEALEYLLSLED